MDADRYIVLNQREQPVELHLGTGTVVVPPLGRIELEHASFIEPQVQALLRARVLVGQPVPALQPPEPSPSPDTP